MSTCCRPVGPLRCYWPDGRCAPTQQPLAQDSPWTIYDVEGGTPVAPGGAGTYAEKVLPNGVVISARIVASGGASAVFSDTCPSGACDPNALTEVHRQNGGFITIEFDATVEQPSTGVRIIDMDNPPGAVLERVQFAGPHSGGADRILPFVAPGGNPGGITYDTVGGPDWYASPGGQSERSAILQWDNVPWGGAAGPITVTYQTLGGNPGTNTASQYDFDGPIYAEPCSNRPRFAQQVYCCEPNECPEDSPLAQSVPWTIYDNEVDRNVVTNGKGDYAEKVLPNGVVITGRVVDRDDPNSAFTTGQPQGDNLNNALTNSLIGNPTAFLTMEYDCNVRQRDTRVRLIDLDSAGTEGAFFDGLLARDADVNDPILGVAGVVWNAGIGKWRSGGAGNRSSDLTFFNAPWGGNAGPVRVTFDKETFSPGGRLSQFDFFGPIGAAPCGGSGFRWVDSVTGEELSNADLLTLTVCNAVEVP